MNGDAAGGELPELTDEDVNILASICKLAARSTESPTKAVFASYETVLAEQGIDPRHDNILFRWVIRLVTPKPGRPRGELDFVKELRTLLEAHNITVVDHDEVYGYDDTEQLRSLNLRDTTRRRVSFDDARYEETWLSNYTHTFDYQAQQAPYRPGTPPPARDVHWMPHARSQSNDRAAFNVRAQPMRPVMRGPEPPTVDAFYPTQAELDEAAEAFLDTSTLRTARRCLAIWWTATDACITERQSDEIIAADHDYRIIVRQALDSIRTFILQRALERQIKSKESDDEERATRFYLLKSTQRFFNHWSRVTKETTALQPPASRHIVGFRYFNRWMKLTLDNNVAAESFFLAKFIRKLIGKTTTRALAQAEADVLYGRSLLKRNLRLCVRKAQDSQAQRHHNSVLARRMLAEWQDACHIRNDLEQQSYEARDERMLQGAMRSWTQRYQARRHQSDTAARYAIARTITPALQSIRQYAELVPRLREHQAIGELRLTAKVLHRWSNRAKLEEKARHHNNSRVAKDALRSWNDSLRVRTLSQRINERLMAEMLYKLMLEERRRLFTRMVQGRLLRESWQKLLATSRDTAAIDERKIAHFTQESERRKLTVVFQRLHLQLRQRDDARRAVVEFTHSRLLPGPWSKMIQALRHQQELNKWSQDAAFFVGTKSILDKWRLKTARSQQEKRRLAYEQVRNRIKARLLRSTFAALRQKAFDVAALNGEATRLQEQHADQTVRQSFLTWRQHRHGLESMQAAASRHDIQKLTRSALITISGRLLHIRDMNELGAEIRTEADLATLAFILKRLRFASFTIARLEDNSNVLRARLQQRHMLQMLRHLAFSASDKRSRARDQEPESPSIRPASRAASRSSSRLASTTRRPTDEAIGTPAYLRTPSRARRTKFRPIPTPAPVTPFSFTPAFLTTTPAPLGTALASSPPALTPQITPFHRKLRASGIATDGRPTSILRSRRFGRDMVGTDKSVRFAGSSSRFGTRQTSRLVEQIE